MESLPHTIVNILTNEKVKSLARYASAQRPTAGVEKVLAQLAMLFGDAMPACSRALR
jgi:hypothetical protein